jgi:hypothetical protein
VTAISVQPHRIGNIILSAQIDADFVRLFTPGVDLAGWDMTTGAWLMKIHDLL